jgi:hypothetical protein
LKLRVLDKFFLERSGSVGPPGYIRLPKARSRPVQAGYARI